ncbi:dehydrase and lipid transport-domain-containing protein [Melampsora americana]|nr:dehydrase and lipid transport-domain-containing protein [Melampsora americana]
MNIALERLHPTRKFFATHTNLQALRKARRIFTWPSQNTKEDSKSSEDGHSKKGDLLIYKETKRMPYSKEQLYQVIADVEAYPHFVPYCVASNLLSHRPLKSNVELLKQETNRLKPWVQGGYAGETHMLESELVVGFKTFEERYTSYVECRKWEMVKASASHSSLFKCLESTWTFQTPKENSSHQSSTSHSSDVSLHLAFAFASPLHAAIGEVFWKKISEKMVLAFENRLEQVYRSSPSTPIR